MGQISICRIDVKEVRHLHDFRIPIPVRMMLASGSVDGSVRLWDASTGNQIAVMAGGSTIHSVRFSPDGLTLASGSSDGTVRLWDANTGDRVAVMAGHSTINSVCFSPDGLTLASGSSDGAVRLWDVRTHAQVAAMVDRGYAVNSVCFSPDGLTLADGSSYPYWPVRLWDVRTYAQVYAFGKGAVNSVCFPPDAHTLADGSSDGVVRLWDVRTYAQVAAMVNGGYAVNSVCFSPDGHTLASGSSDGTVRVWDVQTCEQIAAMGGHEGPVLSVCFSPDGTLVASGSSDGTVRLWDAATGQQVGEPLEGREQVNSVCFSPLIDIDTRCIILTGKNGSGKTSLLDAIAGYIELVCEGRSVFESKVAQQGVDVVFNTTRERVCDLYEHGECVFAYFGAQRKFNAIVPQYIEKVSFADHYGLHESPREVFVKYLLDLKMTQALAMSNGRKGRADEISRWFDGLRDVMRRIYEDDTLTIEFDEDTFEFHICQEGRVPFDINNASDGFSAVLDIVVGLMLRMVKKNGRSFRFDLPGIALVDEIENHLHLSLQKQIIPMLTELFPNIQFVVTTHSPFVLSSVSNAVIYDLENHTLVTDGLSNNTYDSIVEGYFNVDLLSAELRQKYDRYKELAAMDALDDDDLDEVDELELYLDEIPDYLALGIATEYEKLKSQLHAKVVDE